MWGLVTETSPGTLQSPAAANALSHPRSGRGARGRPCFAKTDRKTELGSHANCTVPISLFSFFSHNKNEQKGATLLEGTLLRSDKAPHPDILPCPNVLITRAQGHQQLEFQLHEDRFTCDTLQIFPLKCTDNFRTSLAEVEKNPQWGFFFLFFILITH